MMIKIIMMIVQQVIVVIIAIINSQFQPGDFSAGSTTVTIAVNVLDNKPQKKTQKKTLGESMVAKKV